MAKRKSGKGGKRGNFTRLAEALSAVKNKEEAMAFIHDLLTEEERRSLTKRLHIADWLTKGKTYEEIVSGIGTSMTTVARVSHWLKNQGEGYRITTARLAQLKAKAANDKGGRRTTGRRAGQKSKSQTASPRRRSRATKVRRARRR